MSLTDTVPDVIDYLVAQCQASAALAALGPAGCEVLDGPQPSTAVDGKEYVLWIGHNPKSVDEPAGEAEQGFAFLASSTRDEAGEVICAAKHWSGDFENFAAHRTAVKAVLAAVELLLRGGDAAGGPGDATMGGLVQWSEFTEVTWWQSLADGGAEAYATFKISYFVRLTS